jgi:peptidoglycan/xylan/chitin deacetylase (PgdA/CDA1 family)
MSISQNESASPENGPQLASTATDEAGARPIEKGLHDEQAIGSGLRSQIVRGISSRLAKSSLRSRLRSHPGVQGRILGAAGFSKRLPTSPGLYFPFYHDVPRQYGRRFAGHLLKFRSRGQFVSWDDALEILAGRRELTGPHFCLSFDDSDRSWLDVVLPIVKSLQVPAMFFVVTDYVHSGKGGLTWRDCRELAGHGMRFGSHSKSHRPLVLLDDAEAAREIRDSKAEIEDQLGVPVLDFAAPYGWPGRDYYTRHVELATEAGYRSFANTLRSAMHPGDSPLRVHRQGLHPAWPMRAVLTRVHE